MLYNLLSHIMFLLLRLVFQQNTCTNIMSDKKCDHRNQDIRMQSLIKYIYSTGVRY